MKARLLLVAALLAATGCKKSEQADPTGSVKRVAEAADAAAAPAGELGPVRDDATLTMLAIYYLPQPTPTR